MAIVIVGGLLISTLVNLFILPTLYLRLRVKPAQELELAPITLSAEQARLGGMSEAAGMSGSH